MPTLVQLEGAGLLEKIDALEDDVPPERYLYALPKFVQWLKTDLPLMSENPLYSDLTPQEQVYLLFEDYAAGRTFSTDRRFKKLACTPEHWVWEMKTDSIRIFGWVPCKDFFICCFGDSADEVKKLDRYAAYIARTVYERNQMPLEDPKFVAGKDYADVISS
ncbi:hypothetical protein LWC05_05565 [Acetobacter sicerae]|uniref:Uncharacterized protein n=1 Tax=Acetobacter sicerae TaxID=85325 RepID=A0ABS8VWA0_9PROT|nr:hypothetical protein [Acetobacter sicerae]MCE0743359.1 hypothetical protein [Acetobacter sicerae]